MVTQIESESKQNKVVFDKKIFAGGLVTVLTTVTAVNNYPFTSLLPTPKDHKLCTLTQQFKQNATLTCKQSATSKQRPQLSEALPSRHIDIS